MLSTTHWFRFRERTQVNCVHVHTQESTPSRAQSARTQYSTLAVSRVVALVVARAFTAVGVRPRSARYRRVCAPSRIRVRARVRVHTLRRVLFIRSEEASLQWRTEYRLSETHTTVNNTSGSRNVRKRKAFRVSGVSLALRSPTSFLTSAHLYTLTFSHSRETIFAIRRTDPSGPKASDDAHLDNGSWRTSRKRCLTVRICEQLNNWCEFFFRYFARETISLIGLAVLASQL